MDVKNANEEGGQEGRARVIRFYGFTDITPPLVTTFKRNIFRANSKEGFVSYRLCLFLLISFFDISSLLSFSSKLFFHVSQYASAAFSRGRVLRIQGSFCVQRIIYYNQLSIGILWILSRIFELCILVGIVSVVTLLNYRFNRLQIRTSLTPTTFEHVRLFSWSLDLLSRLSSKRNRVAFIADQIYSRILP